MGKGQGKSSSTKLLAKTNKKWHLPSKMSQARARKKVRTVVGDNWIFLLGK